MTVFGKCEAICTTHGQRCRSPGVCRSSAEEGRMVCGRHRSHAGEFCSAGEQHHADDDVAFHVVSLPLPGGRLVSLTSPALMTLKETEIVKGWIGAHLTAAAALAAPTPKCRKDLKSNG